MWLESTKNGKYKACERYIDPLTGKPKKISVTIEKDTKQARKAAQEALAKKIEKEQAEAFLPEDVTLKTLVEAYRADQKITVRASTYKRNFHAMNTLMDILGKDVLVSRLSASYVRQKFLRTGKSPSTLNEHLTRFHALIMWGYRNDLVPDTAFLSKIEHFKAPPHKEVIKEKYMEAAELRQLLAHMSVPVWQLLTEFLALSGLRVGEAIALEAADVDLTAKQIHVTKTYDSNGKVVTYAKSVCSIRDVRIQPELEKCIRRLITEMKKRRLENGLPKQDLFLFSRDGSHISYFAYNKYLRENTMTVLGRSLTPHSLRHTHASLLMEQGVPVEVISRRLGHENSRVTKEIYLHVTRKLKEKDDGLFDKVSLL